MFRLAMREAGQFLPAAPLAGLILLLGMDQYNAAATSVATIVAVAWATIYRLTHRRSRRP